MTIHRMTPKKRRITKHGNDRWEVDFGTDAVGKKIRLTLKTEAEADAEIDRYKKELKRCREYWARLTELERQTTVAILQEIQSKKLTLTRVWKEHQKWSKDVNKQETNTPMPYSDAVEEFKRRKLAAGKTERYVAEVADMLMKAAPAGLGQRFHFSPRDANGFFEASLRLGVIMTQSIRPPQVQLDAGVGRVQATGALQGFDRLLILLALPGIRCILEQARKRPFGDEPLPLHLHAGENERRPSRMQVTFAITRLRGAAVSPPA